MIVGNKITKPLASGGVTQVAGPNPQRRGLILNAVDSGNCWIALGDTPADKDGIRLSGGTYTPFLLLFDSPNDYITQPILAFAAVAMTISIVELVDRQP